MVAKKVLIKGAVYEVSSGIDHDVLTISNEKQKSKIKVPAGELASFKPGEKVYVTIERDGTLFEGEVEGPKDEDN